MITRYESATKSCEIVFGVVHYHRSYRSGTGILGDTASHATDTTNHVTARTRQRIGEPRTERMANDIYFICIYTVVV